MKGERLAYFQSEENMQWRWRWLTGNNFIIANGEGYTSEQHVKRALKAFNKKLLTPLPIVKIVVRAKKQAVSVQPAPAKVAWPSELEK